MSDYTLHYPGDVRDGVPVGTNTTHHGYPFHDAYGYPLHVVAADYDPDTDRTTVALKIGTGA